MSGYDAAVASARGVLANAEHVDRLVSHLMRQLDHGPRPPIQLIALQATADQLGASMSRLRGALATAPSRLPDADLAGLPWRTSGSATPGRA